MGGAELLRAAGRSPILFLVCIVLIGVFAVINVINGGTMTMDIFSYGPPFQLVTTNLGALVFATFLFVFNRILKTPRHKAMIAGSMMLTGLNLIGAILFAGLSVLDVTKYVQWVLYAAQDDTGALCQVSSCASYLTGQISFIIQGIKNDKKTGNEILAVVLSVLSFLTQGVTTLVLIAREKEAASESGDDTIPPPRDQDFADGGAAPKMDYSDL